MKPSHGLRVFERHVYRGPNVYGHGPTIRIVLDPGPLGLVPISDLRGLERLADRLPGLRGAGRPDRASGGDGRGADGRAPAVRLVERVALELQAHVGAEAPSFASRGRGPSRREGARDVVYAYEEERVGLLAGRLALRVVHDLLPPRLQGLEGLDLLVPTGVDSLPASRTPLDLDAEIGFLAHLSSRCSLGPSTRALVDAAHARGIPWRRLDGDSLVQLGHGRHRKLVRAALTQGTGYLAVEAASDKELTKALLRDAGLPVPRGRRVRSEEEAAAALPELGGRVVVKPLDANQGKGVSLDLTTPDAVRSAFRIAREHADEVLVEEQLEGDDHRVLVVGGSVVAASERLPAHVIGDGERTIQELIDAANRDPRRGEGHEKSLTRIEPDEVVREHLARSGRTLASVPPAGERVFLLRCANLSKGGTARDVTDELHPDVRLACERAARSLGLDVCGVDLVVPDVRAPLGRGGIVEVNASPGLRMHLAPSEGRARDVGGAIVEMLFPPGASGRVPIVAVTGTNGKTTVTRLVAHVLATTGATVGMTSTDGISIGGAAITRGDDTGPASARTVLSDPTVDVAVLETARGGLLRHGLGYDWADVAVLTNVREDHIGQDGIESLEDLVWIKSLVAERVREGGALVLNADDPELVRLADHPRLRRVPRTLIYTSLDPGNPVVRRHVAGGGRAVVLQDGWLTEREGAASRRIVHVGAAPFMAGGAATFQVRNGLSASAACRAHGIDVATIAEALTSFRSAAQNPGRMNVYRFGAGYVILDYGHNPDAIEAVGELVARWERPATAILGVPGDRDDRILEEAARTAARAFARLVLREDRDLRGRKPGEAVALLRGAALREVPDLECRIVLDERDALEAELPRVAAGGIAVVFFEDSGPLLELLSAHGALAVEGVETSIARAS